MKKFIYALTVLLMTAALSSCDGEIKNVTTKNLVGTWDLVSETTVFTDGTKTTTEKSGESIIIGENTYTVVSGNRQTEYSFEFRDPDFLINGSNLYDLVSVTRKEMVLRSNLTLGILISDQTYTYKKR